MKLSKGYIEVGAPKTGSASIQDTMATDKYVLREDNFYLGLHQGEIKRRWRLHSNQLATCIWLEEESTNVALGSGDPNAGNVLIIFYQAFTSYTMHPIPAGPLSQERRPSTKNKYHERAIISHGWLLSSNKLLEIASKNKSSVVISNARSNRKSSKEARTLWNE